LSQLLATLEVLAFSGLWVALAAAGLSLAAALAMASAPDPRVAGVALFGTLAVYGADRLFDVDRDRVSSPLRTDFVLRHENRLALLSALSGAVAVGLGLSLGPRVVSLLALVLAAGLAHRRLKQIRFAKPLYIALAWCAVVVWVPAAVASEAHDVGWVSAVIALAVLANAIASNVRDGEQGLARPDHALVVARLCALLSLGSAWLAPAPLRALAAVPAATLLALLRGRIDERWGLVAVDGALVAGSALAVALA